MAEDGAGLMADYDAFADLAPFYDRIMDHVTYDRWYAVTTAIASLLPASFIHVDAACGTGTLIKQLRAAGWQSYGIDLSFAMLRAGKKDVPGLPVACGDLRALPLYGGVDYVTCLFDSLNFLLEMHDVTQCFVGVRNALTAHGLFYFDVITERMVTEHFDGQEWTESHDRFSTTWRSAYHHKTGIAETYVRVNNGPSGTVLERVYEQDEIEQALLDAGLTLLGVYDAHTWKPPNRRTVRIDFVAARSDSAALRKRFSGVYADMRRQFGS